MCVGVGALAAALASPARAQGKPARSAPGQSSAQPAGTKLNTAPPPGFEDFDSSYSTLFDLTFQERKIGSFAATVADGTIRFDNPAEVAAALGPSVDTAAVTALLSKPLSANEQFRCRPGQSPNVGCGILPAGIAGVILSEETFQVSLFLTREYLVSTIAPPRVLGPPTSGPSLIQTVRFSAASAGASGFSYGGTFDTLASVGRTAFVAQTALSDFQGFRAQQAYGQRVWSDRRAALGLLQDYQSLTFTNYRMIGGEFGSFYGTLVDAENDTATPLEVLLPRRAQVQIYRDAVLMATGQYEAGLQLLDTGALPDGSYTVHIVARDGGQVLLDETRSFSKIANLVPPGKTAFRLRLGERVQDSFLDVLSGDRGGFIPKTTGEFVLSGFAQRRLGRSMAGSATLSSFGSRIYGEGAVELFRGSVSGLFGAGIGSGGAYSALASGTVEFKTVSFYLSARMTRADDDALQTALRHDRYQPFYRSQDTLFGSVQTRLLGGSVSLNGSYTHAHRLSNRYAVGAQYTRSFRLPAIGNVLLTASATTSDLDTRFGVSISFFRSVDRKTDLAVTAGGQYVSASENGGFSPIGEAILTRSQRVGPVDMVGEVGATTDADHDRLFAQVRGDSRYGSADATAQLQPRSAGGHDTSYLFNAQSGFAIGGGAVKIGLRNPAESMVLVDLRNLHASGSRETAPTTGAGEEQAGRVTPLPPIAEGGYRLLVDGKPADYVEPGTRTAIGLQPFHAYTIGLKPEGAPQFDIDATQRSVTLYPGNVARVRFDAQRVVSIFGQVLDARGAPLAGARVAGGSDFAIADDHGYFTITAPLSAELSIKTHDGQRCVERRIGSLIKAEDPAILYRFGKISCTTLAEENAKTVRADDTSASSAIPEPHAAALGSPNRNSGPLAVGHRTFASRRALAEPASRGQTSPSYREVADKLLTARANIESLRTTLKS